MDSPDIAPVYETVSFAATLVGFALVGVGVLMAHRQMRRIGGGLLLMVGTAGLTGAWASWSARAGRRMSALTLRQIHKLPLNAEEERWLKAHSGQLVAGVIALW